jgi:hypothetical protein
MRDILEQETQPATEGHNRNINRINYEFVFLRRENVGLIPEYVFRIVLSVVGRKATLLVCHVGTWSLR